VAEEIARIKDVPLEAVAAATTGNFFALFRGARAAG
jgi:Tat protein secretion system quality control protein TatD with DNase activity